MSRMRSNSGNLNQMTRVNSRLWVPATMPAGGESSSHGGGDFRAGSVHGVILNPSGDQMWLERGDKSAKKMVSGQHLRGVEAAVLYRHDITPLV